ncbi:MAG: DUF5110 domain-containing protein [Reichenbachiella sp.]
MIGNIKATVLGRAIITTCFLAITAFAIDPVFWNENEHIMLPKYAFGYWQIGFAPVPADNANDILRLAQEHRDSDHPGDVWILDLGSWNCTPEGMNGWDSEDWCGGKFDNPGEFIKKMNDMNWHIGMNYHPWGHQSPNKVQQFADVLTRDASYGSEIPWIDIRSSDPIPWMWDVTAQYWKDNGNKRNMMFNYLGSFTFGFTDQDHEWDLGKEAKYATYWTGDMESSWRSYNDQVKRITHDGAWNGLYTLHMDTPGHTALDMKAFPELTARTVQFSDFSPITQQHGQGGRLVKDATPEVQAIMTQSRQHRYRLIPYIYTHNWEMWKKSLPITRPLNMAFPDDNDVADAYQQYMFGENLMVAPVTTGRHDGAEKAVDFGSNSMNIKFPKGETWIDYWSHEVHDGGSSIDYDVSDWSKMPLFVKKGSITPMGPQIKFIDPNQHPDPLTLDIFPADEGKTATYTMYDDDGETLEYTEGKGATTKFTSETDEEMIVVTVGADDGDYSGKPSDRNYIVKLNLQNKKAALVKIGDDEVSEESLDAILNGDEKNGWAFDASNGIAYIAFSASTDDETTVVYSLDGAIPVEELSSSTPEPSSSSSNVESSSEEESSSRESSSLEESSNHSSSDDSSLEKESSDEETADIFSGTQFDGVISHTPIAHIGNTELRFAAPIEATTFSLFNIMGETINHSLPIENGFVSIPASGPQGMLFIQFNK